MEAVAKDGVLHGMARILEPPRPVRLRSRGEARISQHAQWILNKIENTFNETLAG